MPTPLSQDDIDALQIAENTPRQRHGDYCRSQGLGALIATLPAYLRCQCFVLDIAKGLVSDRAER